MAQDERSSTSTAEAACVSFEGLFQKGSDEPVHGHLELLIASSGWQNARFMDLRSVRRCRVTHNWFCTLILLVNIAV